MVLMPTPLDAYGGMLLRGSSCGRMGRVFISPGIKVLRNRNRQSSDTVAATPESDEAVEFLVAQAARLRFPTRSKPLLEASLF